jgi:hypothetical protein
MLPNCLEAKIFRFVHHTLRYLGVDKCLKETRYMFQVGDLGKKLRKFIASCDVCQRLSTPTGLILLRKIIISQQDQEMHAQ